MPVCPLRARLAEGGAGVGRIAQANALGRGRRFSRRANSAIAMALRPIQVIGKLPNGAHEAGAQAELPASSSYRRMNFGVTHRRPSRAATSARTSAPSLMLRTASRNPSPVAMARDEVVTTAGMSMTVASRRKRGRPNRRARTEAWTSAPSERRLLRSTAAVSATGADGCVRRPARPRVTDVPLYGAESTR
jgi:hypothetical protein